MSDAQTESRELVAALQAIKEPLAAERAALWEQLEVALDGPRAEEAAIREKIKGMHQKIAPVDKALSAADGVKFIRDDEIRGQVVAKIRASLSKLGG